MNPLAGRRVLVVEDEAVVAAMIEDMLTELGMIVVGPASTIEMGLDLARTSSLDAAVLDINVRGRRVDEVAGLLRHRSVPIVYASGYGEQGNSADASVVLEKPFRLEVLASALSSIIRTT
jgi:CheY-like chemotaxis protein